MADGVEVRGFTIYNYTVPQGEIAGFPSSDKRVPEEYTLTVVSSRVGVVRAVLQDSLSMGVSSEWKSFLDESLSGSASNILQNLERGVQALLGKSLQFAFTSRRMWVATQPISIAFDLVFEMEYDALNDVVKPCSMLQAMCLPMEGEPAGMLVPPGPSPFAWKFYEAYKKGSDIIAIYIGNFAAFKNVIVKSVDVTYDTRLATNGYPISAKVKLIFETYEIMTKNRLGDVYNKVTSGEKNVTDIEQRAKLAGLKT